MKNYYSTLQLEPSATQEEIKKAYRFLASKYHPDKHDNDEFFKERFIEVQNAYTFLSKPEQKFQYDKELNDYVNPPKVKKPDIKTTGSHIDEQVNQHITWTEEWFERGNWQKALEEIDKAIKLNPKFALLFHIKANICRSVNSPLTALKNYKTAYELGYVDSKSEIIEIETTKIRDQSNYEKVLYKSFIIHLALIFALGIRPKNIDVWLYSGICVVIAFITWSIFLSVSSKNMTAESRKMLNQSLNINLIVAGEALAFPLIPFLILVF